MHINPGSLAELRQVALRQSPRIEAAIKRVISLSQIALRQAINNDPANPTPQQKQIQDEALDAIRERDDIILDESTLTPEDIGQLMGGN